MTTAISHGCHDGIAPYSGSPPAVSRNAPAVVPTQQGPWSSQIIVALDGFHPPRIRSGFPVPSPWTVPPSRGIRSDLAVQPHNWLVKGPLTPAQATEVGPDFAATDPGGLNFTPRPLRSSRPRHCCIGQHPITTLVQREVLHETHGYQFNKSAGEVRSGRPGILAQSPQLASLDEAPPEIAPHSPTAVCTSAPRWKAPLKGPQPNEGTISVVLCHIARWATWGCLSPRSMAVFLSTFVSRNQQGRFDPAQAIPGESAGIDSREAVAGPCPGANAGLAIVCNVSGIKHSTRGYAARAI